MANNHSYRDAESAKDITDRMLSTLESRRDQLASRSAVGLAAASGLLVLAVQFIFDICEMDEYKNYLRVVIALVVCIILSSISLITSLDLIKKINRKKHMGKSQNDTDPNLFYFSWISKQSERELSNRLRGIDEKKRIDYEIRQAISLSNNLEYRYKQLTTMYIFFAGGLVVYVISVVSFVLIKYSFMV